MLKAFKSFMCRDMSEKHRAHEAETLPKQNLQPFDVKIPARVIKRLLQLTTVTLFTEGVTPLYGVRPIPWRSAQVSM
jgi:hypothetical protein